MCMYCRLWERRGTEDTHGKKKGWGRAGEEGNIVEKNIIESEDTSLGPAEGAEE